MDKYKRGKANIVGVMLITILIVVAFIYWQLKNSERYETSRNGVNDSVETVGVNNETETESTKVFAKKNSTYSEFNQRDYEKALSEGKIIYLEFYANWCPICRAQEPDLIEGFNKLNRADVAGFRVNFKDDQTDEDEKVLATKHKIPYQHHKIVLKNEKVVIDTAGTWDAQTLVSELSKL